MNKRIFLILFLIAMFITILTVFTGKKHSLNSAGKLNKPTTLKPGYSEINLSILNESIKLSANYLFEMIEGSGRFKYRTNINPKVKVKSKYNMLRHCGTIYSLATYIKNYSDDKKIPYLLNSVRYLKNSSIEPLMSRQNITAVWSKKEITGSKKARQAKLGGTGLALIAEHNQF